MFLLSMLLFFLFLSMLLILLNITLSKKMMSTREKNSPFECGYSPLTYARLPFSMNFFIVALIFLIFDTEIALIIPIILSMKIIKSFYILLFLLIFIMILIMGTLIEWFDNTFNWIY